MSGATGEVAAYVRRRAGKQLRAVFEYTEAGGSPVYVRPDVRPAYQDGGFEAFQEAAWERYETVVQQQQKITSIGDYRANVYTFEDTFVFQFVENAERGVVLAFDRGIGQNLHEFITDCDRMLNGD